jgi:hypothetical protein
MPGGPSPHDQPTNATMSPYSQAERDGRHSGPRPWGRLAGPTAVWLVVAALAAAAGVAVAVNAIAGLAVAAVVLAFGVFVADPFLIAVIVLPGSILIQRVGGSSTNLSVADLLVLIGALVCLFQI